MLNIEWIKLAKIHNYESFIWSFELIKANFYSHRQQQVMGPLEPGGAPEELHQRKAGECKALILQPSKVQLAQMINNLEPAFQGCDTK